MGFPKGHKKAGGRKPGSKNKITANVKAALVAAFDELGGVEALVKWGKKNPTQFYTLWGRLIPTEIKNADGEKFVVEIVEEIVDTAVAGSAETGDNDGGPTG